MIKAIVSKVIIYFDVGWISKPVFSMNYGLKQEGSGNKMTKCLKKCELSEMF